MRKDVTGWGAFDALPGAGGSQTFASCTASWTEQTPRLANPPLTPSPFRLTYHGPLTLTTRSPCPPTPSHPHKSASLYPLTVEPPLRGQLC